MKNVFLGVVLLAAVGGGGWYYWSSQQAAAAPGTTAAGPTGGAGNPAAAGRGGGRGRGAAMTVETGVAGRHEIIDYITVVGNLIGEATVDVVPRVAGRLDSVMVKLGDRVSKGQ